MARARYIANEFSVATAVVRISFVGDLEGQFGAAIGRVNDGWSMDRRLRRDDSCAERCEHCAGDEPPDYAPSSGKDRAYDEQAFGRVGRETGDRLPLASRSDGGGVR